MNHDSLAIADISKKLRVPKPTLRFWEKELNGMIAPLRTKGGQRRYSTENVSLIAMIKRMRDGGVSLPEVKRKLANRAREEKSDIGKIDLLATRIAEARAEAHRIMTYLEQHVFPIHGLSNKEGRK